MVKDRNGKEIKVGDTVRRRYGHQGGMVVGDIDVVTNVSDTTFYGEVSTAKYGYGHIPKYLEIVENKVTNPLIIINEEIVKRNKTHILTGEIDVGYGRTVRVSRGPHQTDEYSNTKGTAISLFLGGEKFNALQLRKAATAFNELADALDQIDIEKENDG